MISEILKKYEPKKENLLSILHDVQESSGKNYVSTESVLEIGKFLGMTRSEINGVMTFYTMLSEEPRGKYIIRICVSAPCHVAGSVSVKEELKKVLGIDVGETTGDGLFTLEESACLGVCDIAPAMMVGKDVYGGLDGHKIKKIISEYRSRK